MNNKIIIEKLKEYFYNRFKNTNFTSTRLELYNIHERERIINHLAKNQEQAYILNANYEKVLKEIETIFKNNDEYIKSRQCMNNNIEVNEETSEDFKQQAEEKRKAFLKEKRKNIILKFLEKKFGIILLLIIIIFILSLFIGGYYKFAKPVLEKNNTTTHKTSQYK